MAVKKFPIEAGHILLFARAIGDDNKIYSDEDYAKTTEPGAIIAPPTFVIASAQFDPDYPLRPRVGQPWLGSGKEPTGVQRSSGGSGGSVGVRFTRQVWPGDTLTAKATLEALREEGGQYFVDLAVSTVNQDGAEVLSGYASARIDP